MDQFERLKEAARLRAQDPRFTQEPHTAEYERRLSEENEPIMLMQTIYLD